MKWWLARVRCAMVRHNYAWSHVRMLTPGGSPWAADRQVCRRCLYVRPSGTRHG